MNARAERDRVLRNERRRMRKAEQREVRTFISPCSNKIINTWFVHKKKGIE